MPDDGVSSDQPDSGVNTLGAGTADEDRDGILDSIDNSPWNPDIDQTDTAGHGAGDAGDNDDDNDGVSDTTVRSIYILDLDDDGQNDIMAIVDRPGTIKDPLVWFRNVGR